MSAERIDVLAVLRVHGGLDDVAAAVAELIDRAQHLVICHSNGVLIERDVEDLRAALARIGGAA